MRLIRRDKRLFVISDLLREQFLSHPTGELLLRDFIPRPVVGQQKDLPLCELRTLKYSKEREAVRMERMIVEVSMPPGCRRAARTGMAPTGVPRWG